VKAAQAGFTEQNVAASVLNALSGSFQITPMFFVNWNNGVDYNLVVQTPQYRFQSMNDLLNVPLNAGRPRAKRTRTILAVFITIPF
jgi:hypothetical protein